jgi:hypothetical protein
LNLGFGSDFCGSGVGDRLRVKDGGSTGDCGDQRPQGDKQ